jgi:hypothetical protein
MFRDIEKIKSAFTGDGALAWSTMTSSDGGTFDDDFIELGHLKGNIGNQNYVIPPSTELWHFKSAVVWCKRFGVRFAVTPVETARART